jgi:5-methylcytosine-specific restriction endonuclease McrA
MPRKRLRKKRRQLLALWEKGGRRCHWCGHDVFLDVAANHPRKATRDHVIALSLGGADHFNNMVCSCWSCNSAKGNLPLGMWVAPLKQSTRAKIAHTFFPNKTGTKKHGDCDE